MVAAGDPNGKYFGERGSCAGCVTQQKASSPLKKTVLYSPCSVLKKHPQKQGGCSPHCTRSQSQFKHPEVCNESTSSFHPFQRDERRLRVDAYKRGAQSRAAAGRRRCHLMTPWLRSPPQRLHCFITASLDVGEDVEFDLGFSKAFLVCDFYALFHTEMER